MAHLASHIHSSEALRAVARACKGNQQRGILGTQKIKRSRNNISACDRLEIVEVGVARVTQIRSAGVAHVIGSASARKNNAQTTLAHGASLSQERLNGLLVLLIDVQGIQPQLGLLLNLEGGDISTHSLQFFKVFLEHIDTSLSQ